MAKTKASMKLIAVEALPPRTRRSPYMELLQEFLKGKEQFARVENSPKNGAISLKKAIKSAGVEDSVRVTVIGGVIHLVRK